MGMPFVTAGQLERAIKENKSSLNPQEVVDVVNTAIENGDIEIPSGGTKLYKHTIHINNEYYYIVSTKSQPFDNNGYQDNRYGILAKKEEILAVYKFTIGVADYIFFDIYGTYSDAININEIRLTTGPMTLITSRVFDYQYEYTDTVTEL